jgi:hypothetical protein
LQERALAREYPPEQMRIVQAVFEKEPARGGKAAREQERVV